MQPVSQPELRDLSRYIAELEATLEESKKAGLEWKQKLDDSQDTVQRTTNDRDTLQLEVATLRAKCENLTLVVEAKEDGAAMLQLTQKLTQLQATVDRVTKESAEHQQALLIQARAMEELAEEVTRARALSLTLQHEASQREAFERLLARLFELNRDNCALWSRISAATTTATTTMAAPTQQPPTNSKSEKEGIDLASANTPSQSPSKLAAASHRTTELLVHKLASFAFEGTSGGGTLQFHYARHSLALASFRTHFATVTNVFQHVLPDTEYFDLQERGILGQYALLHPTHGLPILSQWNKALEATHAVLADCERTILEHVESLNTVKKLFAIDNSGLVQSAVFEKKEAASMSMSFSVSGVDRTCHDADKSREVRRYAETVGEFYTLRSVSLDLRNVLGLSNSPSPATSHPSSPLSGSLSSHATSQIPPTTDSPNAPVPFDLPPNNQNNSPTANKENKTKFANNVNNSNLPKKQKQKKPFEKANPASMQNQAQPPVQPTPSQAAPIAQSIPTPQSQPQHNTPQSNIQPQPNSPAQQSNLQQQGGQPQLSKKQKQKQLKQLKQQQQALVENQPDQIQQHPVNLPTGNDVSTTASSTATNANANPAPPLPSSNSNTGATTAPPLVKTPNNNKANFNNTAQSPNHKNNRAKEYVMVHSQPDNGKQQPTQHLPTQEQNSQTVPSQPQQGAAKAKPWSENGSRQGSNAQPANQQQQPTATTNPPQPSQPATTASNNATNSSSAPQPSPTGPTAQSSQPALPVSTGTTAREQLMQSNWNSGPDDWPANNNTNNANLPSNGHANSNGQAKKQNNDGQGNGTPKMNNNTQRNDGNGYQGKYGNNNYYNNNNGKKFGRKNNNYNNNQSQNGSYSPNGNPAHFSNT